MDTSLMTLALSGFEAHLAAVTAADWARATPCTDWDVRALANHVLGEVLWIRPLMEGLTIAEVGGRFDGDVLGDDPLATWRVAATASVAAASGHDADTRTVHLSFGDFPGSYYLEQVTSDVVIHTWDLARALGRDDRLDDRTVAFADGVLAPQVDAWRNAGVFGPAVTGDAADTQSRLLMATGRSPDWTAPAA